MAHDKHIHLSRRERQIMDILYERGEASARDVLQALPNPPGYSAVRAMLSKLKERNIIGHRESGPKYLYFATTERDQAGETALKRVLKTFFDNSASKMVNALLGVQSKDLTDEEIEQLSKLIAQAKKRGE